MTNREPPNLRPAPCCWKCKHAVKDLVYFGEWCDKHKSTVKAMMICDDYEAEAENENE